MFAAAKANLLMAFPNIPLNRPRIIIGLSPYSKPFPIPSKCLNPMWFTSPSSFHLVR